MATQSLASHQARRETRYGSGKDYGTADYLILATGVINRALAGLDQRTGGDPRHRGRSSTQQILSHLGSDQVWRCGADPTSSQFVFKPATVANWARRNTRNS